MRKLYIAILVALTCISCGDNGEKKAGEKLVLAEKALAEGDYNQAKIQIDSIKTLYPKAFKARRAGLKLKQDVEYKEQQQALVYLDSILTEKQQAFENIKGRFVLEKNAEYQDIGNYFMPTQTVEKNLHRTFLRFQVSELGELSMTSIYCAPRNIHHTRVKVTAPDGTFAETPASVDTYETSDMGVKIEQADFKLGRDGDVIGFISLNHDKNLRIEYLGDRTYKTTLSANEKKAAAELYHLAQLLSSIQQIKKEIKEAHLKMDFIQKNREKAAEEPAG